MIQHNFHRYIHASGRKLKLSVIIITYNTRQMTLDCLRALYADLATTSDLASSTEVIIVDNASADDTVTAIRNAYPDVRIIANPDNRGFGVANNQGMALAKGEHFLLLNSDAFPKPGAINTLLNELEQQPKTGLIGPRLLNSDGTLQLSCFRFPSPARVWLENSWLAALLPSHATIGDYRKWPHDQPRNVDWLVGACILLKREVYDHLGGFDPLFFMYAEETDWQLRIARAGWHIHFTPHSQVTHLGGASSAARINPHFFTSFDLYTRKHHGIAGLLAMRLAMILGCSARLALWSAAFFLPAKGKTAREKIRLHAWLIRRQLFTAPPPSPKTQSSVPPTCDLTPVSPCHK